MRTANGYSRNYSGYDPGHPLPAQHPYSQYPPQYPPEMNERDKKNYYAGYPDYYRQPMYYPGYPIPSPQMKSSYPGEAGHPPAYPTNSLPRTQAPSAEMNNPPMGAGMYGMQGMQPGSPYPYNYPYYPYSGMPYPYSMYPPYSSSSYYNRPIEGLYPPNSTPPQPLAPGPAPILPPQPNPAQMPYYKPQSPQPEKKSLYLPTVKQEIVISSDEERAQLLFQGQNHPRSRSEEKTPKKEH
jgi:hypothetical protein